MLDQRKEGSSLPVNCCLSQALKMLGASERLSRASANFVLLFYQVTKAVSCLPFPAPSLTYHLHLQCKVVIKGRIFLQVQTSLFPFLQWHRTEEPAVQPPGYVYSRQNHVPIISSFLSLTAILLQCIRLPNFRKDTALGTACSGHVRTWWEEWFS